MNKDRMSVLAAMMDQGVIPVFYHPDVEVCKKVIQACANGGAKCIEFTNRGDFASHVFYEVTRHFDKADPSRDHGRRLDRRCAHRGHLHRQRREVRRRARSSTPTSPRSAIAAAFPTARLRLGERNLRTRRSSAAKSSRCFPASSVGGPEFVKNVMGPMPWTRIMPTGGVEPTEESLRKWFGAGIVACGIGSNLITKELLAKQDYAGIEAQVRDTVKLIKTIRGRSKTLMTDNVLKIRPAAETRWDCASFGEVMLRFDPGFGRVRNARSFQVWEGGGEYNVARAMRKCWGKRSTADHRAARQRSRLAGRRPHDAGWRRHLEDHLARVRRPGPQHARRPQFHRERLRHPRGARLLGSRPLGRFADQARRSELGKVVRRGRRALVPHRRHFCRAGAEHLRSGHRSGRDRAQVRHHRFLRSQLPRVALEEPGRQGRRAEDQSQHREVRRRDDRQRRRLHRLPRASKSKASTSTSRPSTRPTSRR